MPVPGDLPLDSVLHLKSTQVDLPRLDTRYKVIRETRRVKRGHTRSILHVSRFTFCVQEKPMYFHDSATRPTKQLLPGVLARTFWGERDAVVAGGSTRPRGDPTAQPSA